VIFEMRISMDVFEKAGTELLRKASVTISPDVKKALEDAYDRETSETGKTELKNILENIESADVLGKPVCQDTGLVSFFIKSRGIQDFRNIEDALKRATIKATEDVPLRSNAVHPLTRKNLGNNVGWYTPSITWLYEDIDYIQITALLKGAGSENMSSLALLNPGEGFNGIKKFVVNSVVNAGGKPCPPTILGIGIGGTVDLTSKLAKLAILRPIGSRNPDKTVARLEDELLHLVNSTGIGSMGLGGDVTSLDVRIEFACSHIASLPIALNMQCWADRKATVKIYPDGKIKHVV
jgi:fumarate hydratase subunit alpha